MLRTWPSNGILQSRKTCTGLSNRKFLQRVRRVLSRWQAHFGCRGVQMPSPKRGPRPTQAISICSLTRYAETSAIRLCRLLQDVPGEGRPPSIPAIRGWEKSARTGNGPPELRMDRLRQDHSWPGQHPLRYAGDCRPRSQDGHGDEPFAGSGRKVAVRGITHRIRPRCRSTGTSRHDGVKYFPFALSRLKSSTTPPPVCPAFAPCEFYLPQQ